MNVTASAAIILDWKGRPAIFSDRSWKFGRHLDEMIPPILYTTDASDTSITYGFDQGSPWLELSARNDRWVLVGNCESNLQRIRDEILKRGIRVIESFKLLLVETKSNPVAV